MQRVLCAFTLALAVFGCDDHDSHDHGHGNEMSELATGCQHFEFGPHNPDFAASEDETLPEMMVHNHYTVAVPADGGQATFTPPEAGEYIVMLDDPLAIVTLEGASGAVTPLESRNPGEECEAASQAMFLQLDAAAYTLNFSGVSSVRAVIHGPLGEHDHDGHDH
jgi:hypothetical protein